jgi:hypothetical protein
MLLIANVCTATHDPLTPQYDLRHTTIGSNNTAIAISTTSYSILEPAGDT